MTPADSALLVTREDAVVTLTLNRPQALNALNPELIVTLARAWQVLAVDDAVRAIVITGAGERAFCAGADLKTFIPLANGERSPADQWDRMVLADAGLLDIALLRRFDAGKPVIAAINASAIGGGVELIQATDLRIMADSAELALKEVQWGLFPSGGSTVLLPRQLPWPIAMEALLTGRAISADTAVRHGLVNTLVPATDVLAHAQALAQGIAALSPLAVQAIRRSAREARSLPIDAAMANEAALAAPIFTSADAAEGLAAFAARRAPNFAGR